MIPARIDPDNPSRGERDLFVRLRDEPGTEDWIVLHSLDVPTHLTQIEGELDFVIIVPEMGVLCLEVKSHKRVARGDDGMWRLGGDAPEQRGPFKQASAGMHSVRDLLAGRRRALGSVLFWSAVCFPYVDRFAINPTEWHEWQVIDSSTLRSQPLARTITKLLASAQQHVIDSPTGSWYSPLRKEPTIEQCEEILRVLRPSFEFYESPKARRREREKELKFFTEDQFGAIDAMEAMDRVVFEGPAGTGKTLIFLEEARRASAEGGRTLATCYNRLLGHWIQREASQFGAAVRAGTMHSWMLDLAGIQPPNDAGTRFWDEVLPDQALLAILDQGDSFDRYDLLLVDEAQDLLRPQFLDLFDLALKGGLASGRWRFFGDFERQAIYGLPDATTLRSGLEDRSSSCGRYRLTTNCRNTPRVATLVSVLSGLTPGYRRVLRPDNGVEPTIRSYANRDGQLGLLAAALDDLSREGFSGQEVTVLSPLRHQSCASLLDVPPWKSRMKAAGENRGGDIRFATIHAFKGLEAPAVIVTDIDSLGTEEDAALLYVAISRATERLVLLVAESCQVQLAELVLRGSAAQKGNGE